MRLNASAPEQVDILIAGGSVAGTAAAAALSQLGCSVLVVEPDTSRSTRLAGELIHPPGIDGLRELGLIGKDATLGSPVKGFAIFPFARDAAEPSVLLPYEDMGEHNRLGFSIEHGSLKEHLLDTVKSFDGVRIWRGARITEMAVSSGQAFTAVVLHEGGETHIQARLIIGADGSLSQVRKMAGISHAAHRYSGMMGVEVDGTHLPQPGYGNLFLNPAGITYTYGIGNGRARVMFEVLQGGADFRKTLDARLRPLPPAFRTEIERILATTKPLAAPNYRIIPEASVKHNVVLVGDARGCCHPLTASGISTAIKDALILRDALRETDLDFTAALRRYAATSNRLQLTRRTLAEELREAFLARTPESALLNQCIFSYWRTSPKGRAHSMALLSTSDNSISRLTTQRALVGLQAFRLLPHWFKKKAFGAWHVSFLKLFQKNLAFQYAAIAHWLTESKTWYPARAAGYLRTSVRRGVPSLPAIRRKGSRAKKEAASRHESGT